MKFKLRHSCCNGSWKHFLLMWNISLSEKDKLHLFESRCKRDYTSEVIGQLRGSKQDSIQHGCQKNICQKLVPSEQQPCRVPSWLRLHAGRQTEEGKGWREEKGDENAEATS